MQIARGRFREGYLGMYWIEDGHEDLMALPPNKLFNPLVYDIPRYPLGYPDTSITDNDVWVDGMRFEDRG